jgi:Holliday junction resolvase RusA-like endonuclease
MKTLSFYVHGKPQPAGSKRAFVLKGGANKGRAIITDANPKARDWKIDVQHGARLATSDWDGNLLDGPLKVAFTFFLLRPKGHYRTGKNAHLLREDAPEMPTSKPDVLKLARGTEDALTGLVWRDDAQITTELLQKRYGTSEGVQIHITEDIQ